MSLLTLQQLILRVKALMIITAVHLVPVKALTVALAPSAQVGHAAFVLTNARGAAPQQTLSNPRTAPEALLQTLTHFLQV